MLGILSSKDLVSGKTAIKQGVFSTQLCYTLREDIFLSFLYYREPPMLHIVTRWSPLAAVNICITASLLTSFEVYARILLRFNIHDITESILRLLFICKFSVLFLMLLTIAT